MERDCTKIWSDCLALIREHVTPEAFREFFQTTKALKLENGNLTIQVPSHFVLETLEEKYIQVLSGALRKEIGPEARLNYSVVVGKASESLNVSSNPPIRIEPTTVRLGVQGQIKNPFERVTNQIQIDSQLNPSYTMQDFIEGSCNRLAKSAALAIARHPGETAFNPLLIYGGSGLGKTHLAQAIGLEVKRNMPNKVVLYVSTNVFQTQFTEAVRRNEVNDFLHFYQLIDVLILDDIQELAGKKATQNTFFHIFNHLHQSGKQLILTCDKAPIELEGMEERLLSRFRWGLAAEIKTPDFETRKKIALNKVRKEGIDFSEEVIDYICKHVNNNVRELEGAMISLLAQSTFNKCDLTLEVVEEILGKMVKRKTQELTVEKIQQVVCDYFKIPEESLKENTRKREIAQARHLAMYFSKNYTKNSLAYIGNQIGKKDHSTVLYACKVVTNLLATDRKFKMQVEEIQQKLYSLQ